MAGIAATGQWTLTRGRPSVDAFDAWVRPHLALMSNLAARLVGRSDRDDVVQESLVRAWRRWGTYQEERGTPAVWLLAIVADRARRHVGRAQRKLSQDDPATDYLAEADLDLEFAIQRLSRRQRLAIELHYFLDLTVSDVAAVMGCSEGTVKSTLSDARSRLRAQLEER